jgi:hypothetical protein
MSSKFSKGRVRDEDNRLNHSDLLVIHPERIPQQFQEYEITGIEWLDCLQPFFKPFLLFSFVDCCKKMFFFFEDDFLFERGQDSQ